MNQILIYISSYLQTGFACLVVLMAGNLVQALADDASVPLPSSRKENAHLTGLVLPVPVAQIIPVSITPIPRTTIPVLLLADPGMAHVISVPARMTQIQIEGAKGICKTMSSLTDQTGILSLPLAETRHCQAPRVVVLY